MDNMNGCEPVKQILKAVKIDHNLLQDVMDGKKTWEYRCNDKDYRVGDVLHLEGWCSTCKRYTDAFAKANVTYIMYAGQYGIPEGYCIMSIEKTKEC